MGTLMRSIFGVWHAEETVPRLGHIQKTKQAARPLTLAGFDVQISSAEGAVHRPPFRRDMAATVDPTFAKDQCASIRRTSSGGSAGVLAEVLRPCT